MPEITADGQRGPFTALAPPHAALAIGDAACRHVVLSPSTLMLRASSRPVDELAWADMEEATLQLPRVRVLSPRAADLIGHLLQIWTGSAQGVRTTGATMMTGSLHLVDRLGTVRVWEFDGHHGSRRLPSRRVSARARPGDG